MLKIALLASLVAATLCGCAAEEPQSTKTRELAEKTKADCENLRGMAKSLGAAPEANELCSMGNTLDEIADNQAQSEAAKRK